MNGERPRIFDKKNRVKVTAMIHIDLIEAIKKNHLRFSDILNIALEKYLRERGFI